MQSISIEKIRGQARERVDQLEAKARQRMGELGARTSAGLKQVGDQARARVDRFENKARERIDQVVDQIHRALDLPSHEDIEQVKAKLALLEGRLDDLRAQGGAAAFAVPPPPPVELPEFTALAAPPTALAPTEAEATPAAGAPTITASGAGAKRRR